MRTIQVLLVHNVPRCCRADTALKLYTLICLKFVMGGLMLAGNLQSRTCKHYLFSYNLVLSAKNIQVF